MAGPGAAGTTGPFASLRAAASARILAAAETRGVAESLCAAATAALGEGARALVLVLDDDGQTRRAEAGDALLLAEGACTAIPLSSGEESGEADVRGTLAVLPAPPRALLADEREHLATLADLAAVAMARLRVVAELRQAREAGARASRLRDQLLSAVSHELRAPLAALLMWEKLLRDDPDDLETRTRALAAIHDSAVSQSRMVDDLLDVARGLGRRLRVDRRLTSMDQVLRDAVEAAAPAARARHVEIATSVVTPLGAVNGDAARLAQAVGNLLDNAIKFSERGSRITVDATRGGGSVRLEVRDQGRGFLPQRAEELFAPFFQERSVGSGAGGEAGGMGVGLSIARMLVELHGGTLTGHSEGVGRGARFTITVPADDSTAGSEPEAPPHTGPTGRALAGVRVLVVDDDRHVREALSRIFTRAGALATQADSVQGGWTALSRERPNVMVCDISMPGEDGHVLIERVRSAVDPALRSLPSLALTAHGTIDDRDKAFESGFDAHLAKPVEVARLLGAVQRLLAQARGNPIT